MNSTSADPAGARGVGALAAAFVVSVGCYALVPGDTLAGSLAQTTLLAAVALVAVGTAHPCVLRAPRLRALAGWRRWIGFVLALGLAGGVATALLTSDAPEFVVDAPRFVQVVALCLLTGVYEEGVFRVLAMDAFAPALGGGRRGLLGAALASSVLFGLLHVSTGDALAAAGAAGGAIALAQTVLKALQAALFGFFMAALYARTRNLWSLAAVHGVFNLFYLAPDLLVTPGVPQTYVTGSPADLALLALIVALLVPPALAAAQAFRRFSREKASDA